MSPPHTFSSIAVLAILILLGGSTAGAGQRADTAPPGTHQHHPASNHADLFPSRERSGTVWLPDDTPTHGVMKPWREWTIAIHGTAFAQYFYVQVMRAGSRR